MARTAGSKTRNYPVHTLEQALVVISAIVDNGAGKPMDRLLVASAIGRTPSSSEFKRLLSSSRQYGLTTGTEKADYISPTDLGLKITKPEREEDTVEGKVQACLTPGLFSRVYTQYNRNKLPDPNFLRNTLEKSFDVDATLTEEVGALIVANAKFCGILQDISGADYIRIEDPKPTTTSTLASEGANGGDQQTAQDLSAFLPDDPEEAPEDPIDPPKPTEITTNRVFITHGRNQKILNQVKELVTYGKFTPIVAQDRETAAKPVPKKVMDDMRSCRAAVIHVGAEGVLFDKNQNEIPQINGNVLIEIGAAMALYGEKFILLVEEGVKLPSNLQGLYECRYEGDELNMPATMKLLKAFSEF